MNATRAKEPPQGSNRNDFHRNDSDRNSDRKPTSGLDSRYGRIGISAVAAAVRCKGDKTRTQDAAGNARPFAGYESD